MSRTSTHFRLSTTAGRRRVLPVRAWLQAGAAAAAVGFALAGAGTASADDGTAARDSSSAARDSSTQSRVSASSSAPRASAAQAGSRVALAGAPRGPVTGTGKALFNGSGKVIQTPQIYEAFVPRRGNPNFYVAINDPALALWSGPQNKLRTPNARRFAFPEWLRGSDPANPSTPMYNANPDLWVQNTLQEVPRRLNTSPFGIFSPAFPTVDNAQQRSWERLPTEFGTNGDGVSVTRFFGEIDGSRVTPLPFGPGNSGPYVAYLGLLTALATVTPQNSAECAKQRCNQINLVNGNDVVMPGWIGNASISTGAGDDIILASPQVNVAVYFGTSSARRKPEARVYYPTPYALMGIGSNDLGNKFDGGSGNDVIYYDGSVAEAYGGDGDDILAPSFGSFNWAFDTLIQGTLSKSAAKWLGNKKNQTAGFGPPLTVYRDVTAKGGGTANDPSMEVIQGTAVVSGPNALLGPDTDLRRGLKPNPNDRDSYYFSGAGRACGGRCVLGPFNIGLNGDSASGKPKVDTEINKLGGQDLYGGAGDDIIYGIDPDFYKGFKTAANGQGLRVAFNMPSKDGKVDGRQHAQVFQSVNIYGGVGSDYFSLGNPGNLDAVSQDLDSLYRISGNSDSFKDRTTSDFGVLEGDVFEANLTYQGTNWTSSVVGPDGTGGAATVGKVIKGGADAVKVAKDLGKEFAALGFLAFPKAAAIAGVVSFVTGLIQGYTPTPEEPIVEGPLYSDPIGSWRKTIKIQDWDPADSIAIRVDPSNSQSDPGKRWDNVVLALKNNKTTAGEGLFITYKLSGEIEDKNLFLLEAFTARENTDGAWWAWDFRQAGNTGAYVKITKDHLEFFGQVDPSKASVVEKYVDYYSFNVAERTPLFRWTDKALQNANPELLKTLRNNSERIVIQLDTMSLGYHWDIEYDGQASDPNSPITNLGVNEKASKLWVVNPDPKAPVEARWIGYSLEELNANPELAKLAKKATPVWAGPGGNPNLPAA